MRICVIEASHVLEAIKNLDGGNKETYQGQSYSTSFIRSLASRADSLTVIGCLVDKVTDETFEDASFHTLNYFADGGQRAFDSLIRQVQPTHTILRLPFQEILANPDIQASRVAAMLADSFSVSGWGPRAIRTRYRHRQLASQLNRDNVEVVANHNRAATRDLVKIGVAKAKTIPWEWPTPHTPDDFPAKSLPEEGEIELLYVGALTRAKGVFDLLKMLTYLPDHIHLTFVGKGNDAEIRSTATALGVERRISLLGTIPNADVFSRMRNAQIVLVPSHHEYPEGLPKTIREGLTVRTPVVMTDHPMFQGYFTGSRGTAMVREQCPEALADGVREIVSTNREYKLHSEATKQAFEEIDCPNKWADIIDAWLKDDPDGYLKERIGNWA
ncbi:MAG: glycosyltransferase [Parvularcula sp.]